MRVNWLVVVDAAERRVVQPARVKWKKPVLWASRKQHGVRKRQDAVRVR